MGTGCRNKAVPHRLGPTIIGEGKLDNPDGLQTIETLNQGVESITGAARLSVAAISDMLAGRTTPKIASITNQTSGILLKSCALHLRYNGAAADFKLPEPPV